MYPAVRLPPDEDHVSLTGYIWKYTIGGHYCVELYENDDFVGNTQNKNDDFVGKMNMTAIASVIS